MDLHTNPIATTLMAALQRGPVAKRSRGRPRKKDEKYYADRLVGHAGIVAWYIQTFGEPARSEAALYRAFRWHVAQTVEADGIAALAARDTALGSRSKTVANTLAEARAFFKKHPEKSPFTGKDTTSLNESNHITQESDR